MNKIRVQVKSWNRFLTRNLTVTPDGLGQKHVFPFEGATVTVNIPGIKQAESQPGFDEVASVGARRTIDNEPLEFDIHKVDVEVFIPTSVSLYPEILEQNANAYNLLSPDEQEYLNQVVKNHQSIAEKAFEYWLQVMRWVCDDSRIGRDQVKDFRSGWSTYLIDTESNHKVWIQSRTLHVGGYKIVTPEEWQKAQTKLASNSIPPIYIGLKHDAEESIRLGDYRRSIVDLAIACETYLRYSVLQSVPKELKPKLVAYLEEANISQYIDKFFPKIIDDLANKRFAKLKSELFSLFNRRNKLVHMGKEEDLDEKLCLKFLETTRNLLRLEGK